MNNHIGEDYSLSWLVEIQTICREIFSTFNWGKSYENFLQVCEDLNVDMKKLTTFQMTTFANNVRFVFINSCINYSAVRLVLVNVIAIKEDSSAIKDRIKVEEVNCV